MTWKKIAGFDRYWVRDTDGAIFTDGRGSRRGASLLKPRKHTGGYSQVMLRVDGKAYNKYIHRIVAETFLTNNEGFEQVNHKNGIKTDNRAVNLEWCDPKYNSQHSHDTGLRLTEGESNGRSKLTKEDVLYMRKVFIPKHPEFGSTALAAKFGVTQPTANNAIHGVTWRNL